MNTTNVAPLKRRPEVTAARMIAVALNPAEIGIDTALAASADLVAAMARARLAVPGTAAELGHNAIQAGVASMAALADARTHTIRCHRHLADDRDTCGMSPEDVGCTLGKAPPSATGTTTLVAA